MQKEQQEQQGGKYNFLSKCYLNTLAGSWLHSHHILSKFSLLFSFIQILKYKQFECIY